MATNLVGFDSAWVDHPRRPGAICAVRIVRDRTIFTPPTACGFDRAAAMVRDLHQDGDLTLIAIDQPTIVPNRHGMRPAERVVAGTISWSGGGLQPAYRAKTAMFGDDAPIWRFLDGLEALGGVDDPEGAATAAHGLFVMEVYPALALLGLEPRFATRNGRPCYNPANRRRFKLDDWRDVCRVVAERSARLGLAALAEWCGDAGVIATPRKADQDGLDAAICALVARAWREDRNGCVMIGDRRTGYIVAPTGPLVRDRLERDAGGRDVPIA